MEKTKKILSIRRNTIDNSAAQVIDQQKRNGWFDVYFVDDDGAAMPNVEFEIILEDDTTRSCKADEDGYYKDEDVPEGIIEIQLKDGSIIEPWSQVQE